ncbi:MAG: hypothetical protein WAQ05_24645 [Rubrivivax sp.]
MATKFVDFDRSKLHQQVWATPLGQVAQSYGVSNADVKRAADMLAVPLPRSGHWTKVAHGKGIPTPALPEFEGKTSYRHTWWVDDETEEVNRRFALGRAEAAPPARPLPPLQSCIADCLPIVKKMAVRLKKGHRDTRNWPTVSGFQGMFEVSVSPSNQERALLTFDRILRHCMGAGLKVQSDETGREPACFVIDGTALTMRIFESGRREERELTPEERAKLKADPNAYFYRSDRYIFHPTNVLRLEVQLQAYRSTQFTVVDGSELPLAERVQEVPHMLLECARKHRLRHDVREEERKRAELRRQSHQRRVELKRKELEQLKYYEEEASKLYRAIRLRELADGMERCGKHSGAEGQEQVAWIRNAADWLDPLIDKHWPVVDEVGDS